MAEASGMHPVERALKIWLGVCLAVLVISLFYFGVEALLRTLFALLLASLAVAVAVGFTRLIRAEPTPLTAPQGVWLPDPDDPQIVRYWDGSQWTDRTKPRDL
jgi:hypothetical protein